MREKSERSSIGKESVWSWYTVTALLKLLPILKVRKENV